MEYNVIENIFLFKNYTISALISCYYFFYHLHIYIYTVENRFLYVNDADSMNIRSFIKKKKSQIKNY